MESFSTKKTKKNSVNYFCKMCDFNTCKKQDYERHLLTMKHKFNTSSTSVNIKNEKIHICSFCEKIFKDRSGLWKHKKKCVSEDNIDEIEPENEIDVEPNEKELIMMLIKQNTELLEIVKTGTNINSNNNNITNSNNKSFNLQFFLNETCKNAMNITEFVDSLQLQMSDLENVGESGYIEGISSIIIKKLNTLDITERPIHCTDKKRETMYIKDENKWEKEDEKKTKMHKMVTRVANKNINMISEFQKLHPEWKKCSSKYADQHNKIVIESMGGKGDNEYEKQEKIIKKIAKEVFVDKCL